MTPSPLSASHATTARIGNERPPHSSSVFHSVALVAALLHRAHRARAERVAGDARCGSRSSAPQPGLRPARARRRRRAPCAAATSSSLQPGGRYGLPGVERKNRSASTVPSSKFACLLRGHAVGGREDVAGRVAERLGLALALDVEGHARRSPAPASARAAHQYIWSDAWIEPVVMTTPGRGPGASVPQMWPWSFAPVRREEGDAALA